MFSTFEKWVGKFSVPGKFAVTNVAVKLFPNKVTGDARPRGSYILGV